MESSMPTEITVLEATASMKSSSVDVIKAGGEERSGMESAMPTEITVSEDTPSMEVSTAFVVNDLKKYQLKVKETCCEKCREMVAESIREVGGVLDVRVDASEGKVVIVAVAEGVNSAKLLKNARAIYKKAEFVEVDDKDSQGYDNLLEGQGPKELPANPIIVKLMKDHADAGHDEILRREYSRLMNELKAGLEKIPELLGDGKMKEAMEQVEKVLNMYYAIKYWALYLGKPAKSDETEKEVNPKKKKETSEVIHQVDLFNTLFKHALLKRYHTRQGKVKYFVETDKSRLYFEESEITGKPLENYEQTDYMVFLIENVRRDWYIMNAFDDLEGCLFMKCVRRYEEDLLVTYISLVRKGQLTEAEKVFHETIKCMNGPKYIINRGHRYNSVLQEAFGDRVQDISTNWVQVTKDQVPDLVNFFLKDEDFVRQLTFDWIEEHGYLYLILCVWDCYKTQRIDISSGGGVSVQFAFLAATALNRKDIVEVIIQGQNNMDINATYKGITALHIASYKGHEELVKYLIHLEKHVDINVHTAGDNKSKLWEIPHRQELPIHQTALHMATEYGHANVVHFLCRGEHKRVESIRCHEEDMNDITAFDIVSWKLKPDIWKQSCLQHRQERCESCYASYKEILKLLVGMPDVEKGIDKLYRNRQVHVDAANTILVGAALIASVTFAGWLQPPLGYAQYYDFPTSPPAPPGTYDSYIGVEQNVGIQVFSIFNSLSFFFAIATVIVGADAAFPMHEANIGDVVKTMRLLLRRAIKLLIVSVVCVLGAFGSAAVVILPPRLYFRKHLVLTIFIGGLVCIVVLWQLLYRHSTGVKFLSDCIVDTISTHTNIL